MFLFFASANPIFSCWSTDLPWFVGHGNRCLGSCRDDGRPPSRPTSFQLDATRTKHHRTSPQPGALNRTMRAHARLGIGPPYRDRCQGIAFSIYTGLCPFIIITPCRFEMRSRGGVSLGLDPTYQRGGISRAYTSPTDPTTPDTR